MFGRLQEAVAILREEVGHLDPEVLEPSFAKELVESFAEGERLCAAGKALAGRRVASSGAWRNTGERSAAHWMAKATGESLGKTVTELETAKRVAELPSVDQALREGRLSSPQAAYIADAASVDPGAEDELLQAAQTESLGGLKDRCARVKAAAETDEAARHRKIHRSRRLRTWSDPEGAFRLDAKLTPEASAFVLAALGRYHGVLQREARADGRVESYEALQADALVEMARHVGSCTAEDGRAGPVATVHVTVDHAALLRGHTVSGETCEIPGVGPIPVSVVQALAADAFLSVLVTDGADIKAVATAGRTIPVKLKRALEERDPVCVVPGCHNRRNLQIDHTVPFSFGGRTCLENLNRLCPPHHWLKTNAGWRLSGGPGAWVWEPPRVPAMAWADWEPSPPQTRLGKVANPADLRRTRGPCPP